MVVDQVAPVGPRTLNDVPGWFFWMDRLMFDTLLTAQQDTTSGHLVELGCFLGKSAIVIGAYRREDERFVVVDLFEYTDLLGANQRNLSESKRSYSSLTQQAFEQNYGALRGELPEVVAGLSSSVTDHLPDGSVRFMHVDASHLYEAVRGDVAAAKQLLRPGGLVVFDDFRSEHTPGTTAAVWQAVVNDGLVPVALTPNKMYAVFSDPEPYLAAAEALAAADDRISAEWHLIAGHRLIRLGQSAKAKEQERARRLAREDAERAKTSATEDQRITKAVREAVAADRRDRAAAAARAERRKAERAAEREAAATPTMLAGKIRRRVARDLAPPALVRWVRRQRKAVRGR